MIEIPYITTAQMIEVDRDMVEDYHIDLIQMMENAGRNLAALARRRFLDGDPQSKKILILAGHGGNGGGGLVCARRLFNWGADVIVFLSTAVQQFKGVPAQQLDILGRMGIQVNVQGDTAVSLPPVDLIIDALIGYSLSGNPRGAAAQLIHAANSHTAPVLSLDAPSGVDTTSGEVREPAIHASATMTLALPKKGLLPARAAGVLGELYLADISVPSELYARMGLETAVEPIFAQEEIVRLF